MNTQHTPDHDDVDNDVMTRALHDLDAAPPAELTAHQQRRADETLASILAAPSQSSPVPTKVTPLRRRPNRLGRGVLLVAAALALTLVISMSGLLGGGTAYASWTAAPTPRPSIEQEQLAQECRDSLVDSARSGQQTEGLPTSDQLLASDLVLADTRGDWTYVVLQGADGLEGSCLTHTPSSGISSLFGGWSTSMASYGFTGIPVLTADTITASSVYSTATSEGSAWATEGYVGTDVTGVTVVTSDGLEIVATVTGGRFVAWWPDRVLSGEDLGMDPATGLRYIVTLADGTVLPASSYDDIGPAGQD